MLLNLKCNLAYSTAQAHFSEVIKSLAGGVMSRKFCKFAIWNAIAKGFHLEETS